MKWYYKLKLQTKILSGFIVVAILAFAAGSLAGVSIMKEIMDHAKINIGIITLLPLVFCVLGAVFLGWLTVKSVIRPIKKLVGYANRISFGDINIKIEKSTNDEIGNLENSFNKMIQNISENANAAEMISKGDLNIELEAKSENDILAKSMISVVATLKGLESELEIVTTAAINGDLKTRGNSKDFDGEYEVIIEAVNDTLNAVVQPLDFVSGYLDRMANGQDLEVIDGNYKGYFGILINNLNMVRNSLYGMINESNKLAEAALIGDFSVRGDISRLNGGFVRVISPMNDTLDSIVEPLNEAREVMKRMSVNDYTVKITGLYKGTMKEFSEEINQVIDRVTRIQDTFVNLSKGDISLLEGLKKSGKRSENDKIMPSAIATFSIINDLINESKILEEAGMNGDLDVRGDVSKFEGGYKSIITGFNNALDAIASPIGESNEVLSKMASGDLTASMDGDYNGSYAEIKDSINNALRSFNETLGEISNSSDQVSTGSKQVSFGSQSLSQGATQQASSMEELTASISEVAAQTKENALNANEANELAEAARNEAEKGNEQMKEMLKSMEEINESSSSIWKIIKVIDDIAFQTNILALNAAVEAARAGQQGKGFAVVAEEVRNLAARSANAAKQTTELIEGSIKKVKAGTKIADGTAKSLDQIVAGIAKAAELVGNIASASNEQATAISQINKGIEQVSEVIQTNSATAEQSAAASEELSSQAELLKNMVGNFKLTDMNSSYDVQDNSESYRKQLKVKEIASNTAIAPRVTKNKPRISLSDREFGKY